MLREEQCHKITVRMLHALPPSTRAVFLTICIAGKWKVTDPMPDGGFRPLTRKCQRSRCFDKDGLGATVKQE